MGLRSSIVSRIRGASLGVVPILIAAATAATGMLIPEGEYSNHVTILVLGVCGTFSIYAYWIVDDINILCVQVDPESESPARDLHFSEFDLEEGYIEFDTYVYIPEWMDKFVLKFDVDSPLEVGLWEVPDDYNENGDTIECGENAHDFGFVLTVGGDSDKLGTADRKLRIDEVETGTNVDTLTLKSINERADSGYRDQYGDYD